MTQGAVKTTGKRSRAVSAKKKAILSAALDTFSQFGFHGTRLEQIAELAGVSKTNLLYYFPSKEALYIAVLRQILDIWLAPLKAFREDFAPLAAIKEYIRLKLEVSRDYPQASRLFCMEMLAGAPLLMDELTGDLKALIDEKSALIAGWVKSGKLAPIDPQHLIFMIWASTQQLTVIVWKQFGWLGLYEIIPGFIFGSIGIVVFSLLGKAPSAAMQKRFAEADAHYHSAPPSRLQEG